MSCVCNEVLDKVGIADHIHLFNNKLREREDYYNCHRPHGALDGQTPYERLLAITTASASPNILRLHTAIIGRGDKIRTCDPLHPMQVRYQAAPRPDRSQMIAQLGFEDRSEERRVGK